MTSQTSADLGHGVRVLPGEVEGIVVLSPEIDLGWRPSEHGRRGSAVMWGELPYEVIAREPLRKGAKWTLSPWGTDDVMRVVQPLDEASVAATAEEAERESAGDRRRPVAWLLLPLLGFAATDWQRRWRDEWSFPAGLATAASALLEAFIGGMCIIEMISRAGAGSSIFPWLPKPLVFSGIYFFLEGLVRLKLLAADGEPVGSLFGLVPLVFERRRAAPPPQAPVPEVTDFDPEEETLELVSPIQRRDLEAPGILGYRGLDFRLAASDRMGESWVYRFERTADDPAASRLRLMPPLQREAAPLRRSSPGLARTVFLTVATTVAPARFQERWAREIDMSPLWLTIIGASAELLGGSVNLASGADLGAAGAIVNLVFVVEGIVRLVAVFGSKEPMGSVLGLPLTPMYEWLLPESGRLGGRV